jgi:CheY-like chemotaxis protein
MASKVLIVDDNPDIIALLRSNLRMAGFETGEALNGEAALACIEQDRPDVVLLDLMMPVLDGWGVLEALRDRPDRPAVIVVTATESDVNQERAQGFGISGYLTKPFDVPGLIELLRSMDRGTKPRTD